MRKLGSRQLELGRLNALYRRNFRVALTVILTLVASVVEATAAGITVPVGSSLNVNTGTLNVAGDVTNAGTLLLTTGTITLTGNWSNSGTFTAGTGTVNFTAGTGVTQTLNSGGTGTGKLFYHLTHSGAGTLQLVTNPIDIDGNFTNSAGTFDARGLAMSCAGNWSNSATFTHGTNTVTLDGTNQTLTGSTTFYNLTKSVTSAATLTFDNTATQTVANSLSLQGVSGGLLSLRSDASPTQYNLILNLGGTQSLSYLDVKDSNASGGITLIAGSTSTNSGNNTNWVFDGTTVTWDGSSSTDWDTVSNWDLGIVPRPQDTVVIANVANQPILGSNTTVTNLTLNTGATLSLAGKNLTVSSTLTNNGTVQLYGSETVSIGTMDTDSGTFIYLGDGDGIAETFTLPDFGTSDYYNLIINDTNATKDTFQTNANLNVAGNLNVTSGTLDISTNSNTLTTTGTLTVDGGILTATNGNIDANGAVTVSSGTLTAPTTGKSFTMAGNFTHSAGTFTHSSGTVTLDTAATCTIAGSTTFNNLTCTTAGKELIFTAGTTQTIAGTLTLTGTGANKIKLRSSSAGNTYTITDSGTEAVSFVDVQDSIATNSIIAYNSINSGNNTNWIFSNLNITNPASGKTVGQTPTVMGTANALATVIIKDKDGTTVATTIADTNGNFRVVVSTPLATGANSLTPYVGAVAGPTNNLTIVTSPSTDQVPTITSPVAGAAIRGNKPKITGKGKASQTVTLTVKDANGNLLLTDVASSTVGSDGNYTISSSDYTTALPKGTNYLTVTVDGVASAIREVSLVDPYGVVFDSVSNNPIGGAVVTIYKSDGTQCTPGVEIAATDSNPQTTGADGQYSFLAINGDYYIRVSASGYNYPSTKTSFPPGRTIVTGSKGEVFTVAGAVIEMDQPMDSSSLLLLKVKKDANKKNVAIGDIVTYTVSIQNPTSSDVTNVYLEDKIPAGFKYISGKAILDNADISDPTGNRPLTFNIGTVTAGQTRTLKYQLVVGSGVTFGNYENSCHAKYSDGTTISNNATETVKVVPDPLFSLGTTIGKVFWDKNENGLQDKGEEPIPNVQIATEEGTLITTDKDGKFHLAAIIPGRHLFRLDERTLPQGAYLTTDKVVIVDITPGILAKVNFGVNMLDTKTSEASNIQHLTSNRIKITQERTKPVPRLNVACYALDVRRPTPDANASTSNQYEFRIFTNYSLFIDKWKLEILDKDTKSLVKKFEGSRLTINEPIYWDGKDKNGRPLNPQRNYVYVLTVTDKSDRQDVTKERKLIVREGNPEDRSQKSEKEIEKEKQQWLVQESKVNNLDRQNIRIEGETIWVHIPLNVRRRTLDAKASIIQHLTSNESYTINIIKDGKIVGRIPIIREYGLTAKDLLVQPNAAQEKGEQDKVEIILPKGEYDIEIIYEELDVRRPMLDAGDQKGEGDGVSIREVGSMAERNRVDRENLQNNKDLSQQGTVRDNLAATESSDVNTSEYRRGARALSQQDIHSIPLSGEGLSLRSDNFAQDSSSTSISQRERSREPAEAQQRNSGKNQQTDNLNKKITSNIQHLTSNKVYTQHLKVGEDYLFFVGMGDAKMGYTINRGNIEPVQQDDKFKEGFWSEGKLAYYLKGKIKGKYLITSSLDTERDKKELFRNLDPDKYYPVYGDASSINYDATNTQGPLYLLIEWDKSSVIWGDYNTSFTDTEFAQFSRTLYGGKLNYESVSATQFGEPKTKLIVFRARAKQKAAHNEFIGTGGSLFYLKNKDITEGSDKVRIEVRDKITGLVLATKQMEGRLDYQINYSEGRLIFWKPVSQIVESDSIISSHLLDGNPVYVIVDYEYETKDKYDEGTYGGRIQKSLTDYLRIGGTYVKEEQIDKNYELRGLDAILHLGKNIKLTGEYAESESESLASFISTDGGLTFTELATGNLDKGSAYGLKGEGYLFGRFGLNSYYKQIEKGFSSASTISQQGKELMGLGATLDITPKTRLKVSHDIQKLLDEGNPQTQLQVGAKKTETTSAQLQHQVVTDKLKLTGEYRKQQVKEKKEQFESETNTETDIVAVKADYEVSKKTALSLEQQATLKGAPNQQTTLVAVHKPNEWLSLRGRQTIGNQGSATGVGASANLKDKFELSGDITRANARTGQISDTVSVGGRAKVDEKTEVHTTLAITDSTEGGQTQSLVFSSERKVNDELRLASSKTYAKNKDKLTQADTYGLVREKEGRKVEGTLTTQSSRSNTETSNTNIFGLSGDINDRWAGLVSFERGIVQNHDGTQATRNAGSVGLGFIDKDKETGEVNLKASSKLELRLDSGQQDKRQFLLYNAIEGKINPNTTLFAKANISQTKNTTTKSTEAQYKELSTGVAYRPLNFDRLNLLGRYTYLEDNSPLGQTSFKDIEKEKSHTLAGEAVYDLTPQWQFVEKLAYKMGEEQVSGFEFTKTQTWLMIHRLNYNFGRDWQVGGEYRRLAQTQAKDYKQGVLVEVARKIGEFIQVGSGYNFTNFNDDLTHLNYTAQGPFIRLTGKFYDRTPEEIERARQIWLEQMIKLWTQELVNEELARPGSKIMQELYKYFYLAEKLYAEGKLKESEELYEKILEIGNMMYQEAEVYVRNRIELEKSIKENHRLALIYYKEGKRKEAKALWQKILKEAEPKPIIWRW